VIGVVFEFGSDFELTPGQWRNAVQYLSPPRKNFPEVVYRLMPMAWPHMIWDSVRIDVFNREEDDMGITHVVLPIYSFSTGEKH